MPRSEHDPRKPAEWLCAIGEPTRLAILRALSAGDLTVTEIAKACALEMVNASHHLNPMKNVGLLSAERRGRCQVYSLVGAKTTATLLELTHESGIQVTIPLG